MVADDERNDEPSYKCDQASPRDEIERISRCCCINARFLSSCTGCFRLIGNNVTIDERYADKGW